MDSILKIFSLVLLMMQSCSGSVRLQPKIGNATDHVNKQQESINDISNLPDIVSKKHPTAIISVNEQLLNDTTIYQKQMEFIRYNDDGDYFLLIAKDDKGVEYFINNDLAERDLNRGDLIQVVFQNGIISISGEGETPEAAVFLISVKKIEDGRLSRFRKTYQKDLLYIPGVQQLKYTDYYMSKIRQDLEYYLVNTSNRDLLKAISRAENILYSLEEEKRNNRMYLVVVISVNSSPSPVQWIYIDQENGKIWEWDEVNNILVNEI